MKAHYQLHGNLALMTTSSKVLGCFYMYIPNKVPNPMGRDPLKEGIDVPPVIDMKLTLR